jgi:transcription elongation factor Elf1
MQAMGLQYTFAGNSKGISVPEQIDGKFLNAMTRNNLKGFQISEDVDYMESEGIPLDLHYLYERKLVNPIVSFVMHVMDPRSDFPFIDENRMTKEQQEATEKRQKEIKKEQKVKVRQMLMSEFESKLAKQLYGRLHNTVRNQKIEYLVAPPATATTANQSKQPQQRGRKGKNAPPPKSSSGTLRAFFQVGANPMPMPRSQQTQSVQGKEVTTVHPQEPQQRSYQRFFQCPVCSGTESGSFTLEELKDPKNGTSLQDLPTAVCSSCKQNIPHRVSKLERTRDMAALKYRACTQICTGCVYMLDSPTLDPSNCKSTHCETYKEKNASRQLEKTAEGKLRHLRIEYEKQHGSDSLTDAVPNVDLAIAGRVSDW